MVPESNTKKTSQKEPEKQYPSWNSIVQVSNGNFHSSLAFLNF